MAAIVYREALIELVPQSKLRESVARADDEVLAALLEADRPRHLEAVL
jgi:hypothetical protein